MSKEFAFPRRQLEALLGVDVVPGILANTWNSLVVNRQIKSPYLMPWHSITRTEYMTRIRQQGDNKESTFHGRDSNTRLPAMRKNGLSYYEISTGYGPERPGCISIGFNFPDMIAVPSAIGVIPPGPYFPTQQGYNKADALRLYFDYSNARLMPVRLVSEFGHGRPQTYDSMVVAVQILGDSIAQVKAGLSIDFDKLNRDLTKKAGLQPGVSKQDHLLKKALSSRSPVSAPQEAKPKKLIV